MPRYLYPPVPASPISSLYSDTTARSKIPNSIFISSLHCHTVLINESISISFFPYSFKSFMKNRWLNFAPFFSSLYLIPVSLNIWVNGNEAIKNSNDDSESPWNISLLMGTDPSSFPSAYKLVFYLFILCLIRPMILSAKPTIPIVVMIHEWGILSLLVVYLGHA